MDLLKFDLQDLCAHKWKEEVFYKTVSGQYYPKTWCGARCLLCGLTCRQQASISELPKSGRGWLK